MMGYLKYRRPRIYGYDKGCRRALATEDKKSDVVRLGSAEHFLGFEFRKSVFFG